MDARSFLQVGTCLRQMFTGRRLVSDDKEDANWSKLLQLQPKALRRIANRSRQ